MLVNHFLALFLISIPLVPLGKLVSWTVGRPCLYDGHTGEGGFKKQTKEQNQLISAHVKGGMGVSKIIDFCGRHLSIAPSSGASAAAFL